MEHEKIKTNYRKLLENVVESWKVDAVRALRDAIPLKPKKYSWLIVEWADKVSVLRDMSVDVLENKWMAEEFSAELENNSSQAKFFVVRGYRMEH